MFEGWTPAWDLILIVVLMGGFGFYIRRITREGGRGVQAPPPTVFDINSEER